MSLATKLVHYCHDITQGKIIACTKHKQACSRFLRDLKRQHDADFPYLFDGKKAQRFLRWMSYFKHTKGIFAGEYISPHPIQTFVFANIYGWVHKDTGQRRFRKIYWQVGRKNAKSQSLALVALYELIANGEGASEVYCAATKKKQAKIVWDEARLMVRNLPDLRKKVKIANGEIRHLKSESFMVALSKEDGKTGDGTNVQCGIVDEYHLHPTSEMLDVLVSGMGARKQPLLMIITTAGFNLNHPCYRVEYPYVSKIVDPDHPMENEEYFVMINELDKGDDIEDRNNWIKANPILCSYDEGMNYLRGELVAALDVPEKQRNFLTKNMNIWIDQKENGYMMMDKWKVCGDNQLPSLTGRECYIGIDLSSKIDLTSIAFEFVLDTGQYVVLSHSFMPEDTIQAKVKTDRVPYDLWVRQGWITATKGTVVDYRFIYEYIKKITTENSWIIKEIAFDPYNATQFAQELESDGYEMIEIRQGVRTMSEPTKNFRELVLAGKIIHDHNPVLAWAISNAVTRQDYNMNIMLDKDKSTHRIDPIAAVINAHVRAMLMNKVDDLNSHIMDRGFSF